MKAAVTGRVIAGLSGEPHTVADKGAHVYAPFFDAYSRAKSLIVELSSAPGAKDNNY